MVTSEMPVPHGRAYMQRLSHAASMGQPVNTGNLIIGLHYYRKTNEKMPILYFNIPLKGRILHRAIADVVTLLLTLFQPGLIIRISTAFAGN
jgi:hypothetical protein